MDVIQLNQGSINCFKHHTQHSVTGTTTICIAPTMDIILYNAHYNQQPR